MKMKKPDFPDYKFEIILSMFKERGATYLSQEELHSPWELYYTDRGRVHGICGENAFELAQGEMILIPPDTYHVFWTGLSKAPTFIVINFTTDFSDLEKIAGVKIQVARQSAERLTDIVQEFGRRDPVSNNIAIKILAELLLRQYRRFTENRLDTSIGSSGKANLENEMIKRIDAYIEEHISENVDLEQLSGILHLHKYYLSRLFKSHKGESLSSYINGKKIARARELIRTSSLNFTQIAERMGYQSLSSFSRAFKRSEGISPAEYSKSIL